MHFILQLLQPGSFKNSFLTLNVILHILPCLLCIRCAVGIFYTVMYLILPLTNAFYSEASYTHFRNRELKQVELSKLTWLVSGEKQIQTQGVWFQS